MAIQIVNNFLPNLFFKKLNNIFNSNFNWFWIEKSINEDSNFMFTHILWDYKLGKSSPYFETFEPIIYFLDRYKKVSKLRRMKLNLYTNQGKRIDHAKHCDIIDEKDDTKAMNNVNITLLNFTTCNGGTTIKNKDYKSISNQALMFKNNLKHNGYVQTNSKRRIVLNIATS